MREGWEIKKLGDCFESVRNGANIKQYDNAKGIPITRIETLSNDRFNRDRMGYADITDTEKYSSYVLNDGDILMSHINSVKYLGRAVQYKKCNDEIIIHGMNLLRLTPNSTIILSSYAEYYFKCYYFKDQIANITKKAVNQASFSITALNAVNVFVPPLSEQKRIVAELDLLSEVIAKKREQLTQLDALAQSLFYTMFGDPITNEKGWETKSIDKICVSKKEIKRASSVFSKDDRIIYIDISSIDNVNNIIMSPTIYNFGEAPSRAQQVVQKGDILISLVRPNLNNVSLITTANPNLVASSGFCVLRATNEINTQYLFFFVKMDHCREYLMQRVAGANYPAIKTEDIMRYKISLPPLALQQQFAEKIEAIEQQKERIRQSLAEVQLLFDSRMDYYFNN